MKGYRRGYRRGFWTGIRKGSLGGHPLLPQLDIGFELLPGFQGFLRLAEGGFPLFGHGEPTVLVEVGEVHTEAQALDVVELEIAVWNVTPGSVPSREHVRSIGVVVGRGIGDAGDAGVVVEEKMALTGLVRLESLRKILFDVCDRRLLVLALDATGDGIVQRVDTHAFTEARQDRAKGSAKAHVPDLPSAEREPGPPIVVVPPCIDQPRHQMASACRESATTAETAIAAPCITNTGSVTLSRQRRLGT